MIKPNQVTCGDSAEVLPGIADNSIDCIATDPPYGIGFMSKKWDSFAARPPTQSQTVGWMSPGMKVETQGDGAFEKLNEIVSPQGAYEHEKGFKKLPRQSAEGIIDFFVPIWQDCLRILKPGGLAFVMAPSRSDCLWRQCAALEQAGFDVSLQPILWCYNQGFPKALDISKDFDKAAFRGWSVEHYTKIVCPFAHKHKQFAKLKVECPECKRIVWAFCEGYMDELTLAHIRKATSAAVNGQYAVFSHATGTDPTGVTYSGVGFGTAVDRTEGTLLLSSLVARFWEPLSEQEKLAAWEPHTVRITTISGELTTKDGGLLSLPPGVRVKVGEYKHPSRDDDWTNYPSTRKSYEAKNTFAMTPHREITAPSVDLAIQYDGFKSHALKPAFEFVIVARKPMSEKPIRENVKKHGVGGYNIDAGRVPFGVEGERERWTEESCGKQYKTQNPFAGDAIYSRNPEGCFPANLISSDGAMGADNRHFDLDRWAAENGFDEDWVAQAQAGLLRIAKPAKKEKEAGCGEADWQAKQANPHYGKGGFKRPTGEPDRKVAARKNDHPTCKPVALFGWLLALGCPRVTPDGKRPIMVDPFVGSGSSLVAAIRLGIDYIGIDQDEHYCEISEARTAHAKAEQSAEQKQGRLL